MNRADWNLAHSACPQCGNVEVTATLIGVPEVHEAYGSVNYEDNMNTAKCPKCGWAGNVNQLVAANTGAQKQADPLRVIDYEGFTYICTQDLVATIGTYNKNLVAMLKEPSQVNYTNMLLQEVVKMMVTVDKQHWTNKAYAQQEAEPQQLGDEIIPPVIE